MLTDSYLLIGQFSFSLFFNGHHLGSTFSGIDRNRPIYQIGPDCAGHEKPQKLSFKVLLVSAV